jgi:hypothetical protein
MLYEIVKDYAGLGIHRTGTDVDRATINWFESHLRARGAKVLRQDYTFDFFEANTTVILDGCEIPSMPLYYEAIGDVKTDNVAVGEFGDGEHGSGLDDTLEAMINDAMSEGCDTLVIATRGETDGLVAINCEPMLRNRIPVVLVPGRYANALRANAITVEYTSTLEPGASSNLTGHWGASLTEPPFVITTPMSGWFTCAGERGTGIAVALHVAEWLSRHMPHIPLKLIVPSGHELGFYGAYRFAETVTAPPRAVLHLGSCIAACDARMQGIVHANTFTCDAVKDALAPIYINPEYPENHLSPDCWVGESQCWAKFGMPMLSVAGISPLFHTPDDIAEKATTPELLKHAADCITKAALALIRDYDSI